MLKRFKVSVFIFFISSPYILYGESSLYGFGTDVSDNSNLQDTNTINNLKQKIAKQDERIDGLTTIIEGLSTSINELKMKKNTSFSSSTMDNSNNNDILLKKLAKMIDNINNTYVTKIELSKILNCQSITKKDSVKSRVLSSKSKSISSIYSEGVRLFVKKHYSDSKKKFIITDERGYKTAASNYYLGEISYYTKEYKDAIFYYKKSAGINDKTSYIDVLLLHTAISLEKTNQKSQAKIFYKNIIENYANKKSAKIAQDRIKNL